MPSSDDLDAQIDVLLNSSAYRKAYVDEEFIRQDACRPVRLQLELLKPEMILQDENIESTIVVFGSARTLCHDQAQAELDAAQAELAKSPDDADAQATVKKAEKRLEHSPRGVARESHASRAENAFAMRPQRATRRPRRAATAA